MSLNSSTAFQENQEECKCYNVKEKQEKGNSQTAFIADIKMELQS